MLFLTQLWRFIRVMVTRLTVKFHCEIYLPLSVSEDEMVERYHQLNGHEFEQAPRVGDGQGSLVCCSPWDHKELGTTERLN